MTNPLKYLRNVVVAGLAALTTIGYSSCVMTIRPASLRPAPQECMYDLNGDGVIDVKITHYDPTQSRCESTRVRLDEPEKTNSCEKEVCDESLDKAVGDFFNIPASQCTSELVDKLTSPHPNTLENKGWKG